MENEENWNEGNVLTDEIWEEYYRIKVSKCYFGRLAHLYWRGDIWIKLILAVLTSSAVGGLKFWRSIPYIWEVASALAIVTAIYTAVFNFQQARYEAEKLEDKFAPIAAEYKRLMRNAERGRDLEATEQRYNNLMEKEEYIQIPSRFKKYKKRLLAICEEEVARNEGIQLGGIENG